MNNIYAAPEADLQNNISGDRFGGNIDDAIAGNIDISMTGTLGDAWRGLKGFKTPCILAGLLYFALSIAANFVSMPVIFGLSAMGADPSSAAVISSVIQIAISIVIMPVVLGIHILGMRHYAGKSTSATAIFGYFNKIPPVFLCYLIMMLMMLLGFALLVLPGIYLMVGYMFALALVVEKDMPAWRSLETSRKALSRVWFRFFGLLLLLSLINTLGILTLFIAWIWTIPWSVLTMSMVYTRLFGAEAQTLAD